MAIISLQTITPQMRKVLMTTLHRQGSTEFDIADVSERTITALSLRGWITTRAIQERSWRQANGKVAPMITVGYQVTLTDAGRERAQQVDRT